MLDRAEEWRENHGYLYMQFLLEEGQKLFYEQTEDGSGLLVGESSLFLILPDHDGEALQQLLQWKQVLEQQWDISTSAGIVTEQGIGRILLQSVADVVHLSKSYFSLYFKKQTGQSF